jgi:hypothetical protein
MCPLGKKKIAHPNPPQRAGNLNFTDHKSALFLKPTAIKKVILPHTQQPLFSKQRSAEKNGLPPYLAIKIAFKAERN